MNEMKEKLLDEIKEELKGTFKHRLFDKKNDRDFETAYKNMCVDMLKDILDNNSVKIRWTKDENLEEKELKMDEYKRGYIYDPMSEDKILRDDMPAKLTYEDAREKATVDIRSEHKVCGNNDDGFCVESVRLAGNKKHKTQNSYVDKIHEHVEILRKFTSGEEMLKEMSYVVRGKMSSIMQEMCDKIIVETKNFKHSLNK